MFFFFHIFSMLLEGKSKLKASNIWKMFDFFGILCSWNSVRLQGMMTVKWTPNFERHPISENARVRSLFGSYVKEKEG